VATFRFEGLKLSYAVHGSGPRVLVLAHGLLMNQGMYAHLAPEIARRGNRVVTLDLLGHGGSDQPRDPTAYSMIRFGRQIIALLDHLELAEAVIGGTSLGANVTLEAAFLAPDRVRAMVVEMPVLENALIAAGALFIPLALSIRLNRWGMDVLAAATRRVPRTHYLADILLDWIRREPETSLRVLEGLLFGRMAPPPAERRTLDQPALVIGHRNDPLHPFNDAEILTRELPHAQFVSAKSILEWRLAPARLDGILARFLDEVWKQPVASLKSRRTSAARLPRDAAGGRNARSPRASRTVGRAGPRGRGKR
jgi:pimeloyl-ACP methyl ester carboxylesterase